MLYSCLINLGHYPKYWKQATGAILKKDKLNNIFYTTSTVQLFLIIVIQISQSQGKPLYKVFSILIKIVNFKKSTIRYTEFIYKLYTSAKVIKRSFSQDKSIQLVSINYLIAKSVIELNPKEQ